MANSYPMLPDLSSMIQAARDIVFTARRQNQLSSLTVKSVRKQVTRDFGLDETMSNWEDIKLAIRSAVNDAVSEELPKPSADKPVQKRKRSPEDAGGIQDSMPYRLVSKPDSRQRAIGEEGVSRKKPRVKAKSKKIVDSDGASPSNEPASSLTRKQNMRDGSSGSETTPRSKHGVSATVAAPMLEAERSESELSVLIDQPPKKKRTKKEAKDEETVSRKTAKSQKGKEPPTTLDKDEATIKKLKSFVSACGIRKVWSKEFSDLPMAKQQIRCLKNILAEVGMDGKYSMEKARTIREKRELARELDDVLEFERKAGASRSRTRQTTKRRVIGELDTESGVEDGSENEKSSNSPVIKRNKNTASKSIMAYLANQSSDED